jgi:glycerophosphoryl diester phosphodiesterase
VIREVNQYVKENGYPVPRYNIEIKSSPDGDGLRHPLVWEYAQLLYDVIASNGLVGVADVQSFDPRALEAMHAINPNVGLVWLISNQEGFEANMAKLTFTPNVYSPNHNLVDSTLVEQVHAANMKLVPWTVNEVERIQEIIDLGADGLITDYPDRAKLVLASSNQ